MKNKVILFAGLILILVILATVSLVFPRFESKSSGSVAKVISVFNFINPIPEIETLLYGKKNIITTIESEIILEPEPIVVITKDEILYETNQRRKLEQINSVTENKALTLSAQWKVIDMFEHQYFEHVGPTGEGVAELVTEADYVYVSVAENLALGNFTSADEVVEAWMNSPGHRANILNKEFTEMGIGIAKGEFEGKTIWLVVQHFGRPLSLCPTVDAVLKATIDTNELQIDAIVTELDTMYQVIETQDQNSQEYVTSIETYNNLVGEYELLVDETQNFIETYNEQIRLFNVCVT